MVSDAAITQLRIVLQGDVILGLFVGGTMLSFHGSLTNIVMTLCMPDEINVHLQ